MAKNPPDKDEAHPGAAAPGSATAYGLVQMAARMGDVAGVYQAIGLAGLLEMQHAEEVSTRTEVDTLEDGTEVVSEVQDLDQLQQRLTIVEQKQRIALRAADATVRSKTGGAPLGTVKADAEQSAKRELDRVAKAAGWAEKLAERRRKLGVGSS